MIPSAINQGLNGVEIPLPSCRRRSAHPIINVTKPGTFGRAVLYNCYCRMAGRILVQGHRPVCFGFGLNHSKTRLCFTLPYRVAQ